MRKASSALFQLHQRSITISLGKVNKEDFWSLLSHIFSAIFVYEWEVDDHVFG